MDLGSRSVELALLKHVHFHRTTFFCTVGGGRGDAPQMAWQVVMV